MSKGNSMVNVAWHPWEIELLRGAMVASDEGDTSALRDCIHLLPGRTRPGIVTYVRTLRLADHAASLEAWSDRPKKQYHGFCKAKAPEPEQEQPLIPIVYRREPMPTPEVMAHRHVHVSDFIRPATKEMLMGARAPYRQKFAAA